jgi:hypothetical protein
MLHADAWVAVHGRNSTVTHRSLANVALRQAEIAIALSRGDSALTNLAANDTLDLTVVETQDDAHARSLQELLAMKAVIKETIRNRRLGPEAAIYADVDLDSIDQAYRTTHTPPPSENPLSSERDKPWADIAVAEVVLNDLYEINLAKSSTPPT